ncbi:MAG: hypothetical protein JSS02_16460, partial [Planctomycetes bacterium]|nr:hypothetical protein [Planctomycetota bacterium]
MSVANVGSGVLGSIVLHNAPRSLHPQVGDFFFGDGPALGHRSTPWAESQIVAVVVNTDEEIQLDEIGQMEFGPNDQILIGGELVRLPDLQQVLESYQGQDRVFIFC